MCSIHYKYFDHLKRLSHVEQFVHLDTESGPKSEWNHGIGNVKILDIFMIRIEYEVNWGHKETLKKFELKLVCSLTWNELFLLNVTIFSTLPKRWNIWCKISNETGYNRDSTITRKTVFGPPVVIWWTPCDIGSVPDMGRGEPDAGDVTWKSWVCNATDAF